MKHISVLFITLLLFLSGCGQSDFDNYMRIGKDSLQKGDFKVAVENFDLALIEEPSDNDAALLLKKAKEELHTKKLVEEFTEYHKGMADLVKTYIESKKPASEEEASTATAADYKKKYDDMEDLKKQAISKGLLYQNNEEITNIHKTFLESVDESIDALGNLTAIMVMIEDESRFDSKKVDSFSKALKDANQKSNELIYKYVDRVKEFRENHNLTN